MPRTEWAARVITVTRVDLAPDQRPPSFVLVAGATAAAVAVSLGADAVLARAATAVFPSTTGYAHFRFLDYAPLTAIGVVAAGLAWPVVARLTSQERWLFSRLAVAVTVVLLTPDAWLLAQGEPAKAVAALIAMHLAIAVLTYNLLVHAAPVRAVPSPAAPPTAAAARNAAPPRPAAVGHRGGAPRGWRRAAWLTMAGLVGVETVLGIAALVVVPVGRPDGYLPKSGEGVYLAHALGGMVLGIGAAGLLLLYLRSDRLSYYSAVAGLVGTAFGAGGGLLAVYHPVRPEGMALMFLGAIVAGVAYLTPVGFAEDLVPDLDPGGIRPGRDAAARPDWADGDGGELTCLKRHRVPAAEARRRAGPDVDAEEWASVCLRAGTCPLCPDKRLRPIGSDRICGCCETIYSELSDDGGDAAWMATPGRLVTRRAPI
jgi:hypothetical protein